MRIGAPTAAHRVGHGAILLWLALCATLFVSVSAARGDNQSAVLIEDAIAPWTGDLSGIAERGYLRVGVPHGPLFVAYDGEKQIGLAVERARELQKFLADAHDLDVFVMLVPLPRDKLIAALADGRVDMLDANLTITEQRAEQVSFTDAIRTDVREIVITSAATGPVGSLDALAEIGLFLRPSSSYFAHVTATNAERTEAGAPEIPVTPVPDHLEDGDLAEMVQGGLIPAIVIDDHKAGLLAQIFDGLVINEELAFNEGGEIAFAVRKEAPELLAALNGFVAIVRKGTLLGNILDKRYLDSAAWVKAFQDSDAHRYRDVAPIIRERAEEFALDWRLIIAQAYQESQLDQSMRSNAGAVGVMQVLPSTAKDPNVGISDISTVEPNVHAGVKYLRFLKDRYFDAPEISDLDRVLFALAAYNAGPGNIRKARERAEKMGLDANVWFDNVEIATAKAVSREPVVYVRNIYKYSVYFSLLETAKAERTEALETVEKTVTELEKAGASEADDARPVETAD
ncbi:MAG: transglycosylase SLT domain-containing protein [Pikeienuella sp.]